MKNEFNADLTVGEFLRELPPHSKIDWWEYQYEDYEAYCNDEGILDDELTFEGWTLEEFLEDDDGYAYRMRDLPLRDITKIEISYMGMSGYHIVIRRDLWQD